MEFLFGFIFGFLLFEPIIINFIYLFNIDLFLDFILLKKKKYKLIKHILKHFYLDKFDDVIHY